jgi:2-polyprenyl-6-methoxyphenol hydroxylase-like FAD-dependent oxidoreductase
LATVPAPGPLDQSRLHRDLGTPTLIVHRGDLQRLLLDAASHLPIRMTSPADRVGTEGDAGVVGLPGGETLRAPVVLGCDGIGGVARSAVANPPLTYRGRTSWRAVLGVASGLVPEAWLTVGQGKQFVAGPLRGGATYWAADVGLPEGANALLADGRAFLLGAFSGWHHPIAELIGWTHEDHLVTADFYDSIPRALTNGRVALLGDAAHPMTPDLGQGACQAIEDGVVVAACPGRGEHATAALADYEAARLPRVRRMVRTSRRIGTLATANSEIVATVRDAAIGAMPDWPNSRLAARYASEASFLDTLPAGSGLRR